MKCKKVVLAVLTLVLVPMSLFADTEGEKKGLEELFPQFKKAWSTGDFDEYVKILHPENQLRKIYEDSGYEMKENIKESFTKVTRAWGTVSSGEVKEYDEQTECFLIRITFMTKGEVKVALKMKKDGDGKWLIHGMKVGGPEQVE